MRLDPAVALGPWPVLRWGLGWRGALLCGLPRTTSRDAGFPVSLGVLALVSLQVLVRGRPCASSSSAGAATASTSSLDTAQRQHLDKEHRHLLLPQAQGLRSSETATEGDSWHGPCSREARATLQVE